MIYALFEIHSRFLQHCWYLFVNDLRTCREILMLRFAHFFRKLFVTENFVAFSMYVTIILLWWWPTKTMMTDHDNDHTTVVLRITYYDDIITILKTMVRGKFWVMGGSTGDDSYDHTITDKVQAYRWLNSLIMFGNVL